MNQPARPVGAASVPVPDPSAVEAVPDEEDSLVEEDVVVQEVSIDGMCGVY